MRIAKVLELAPKKPKDHLMVVNLSGRGDKDLDTVAGIWSPPPPKQSRDELSVSIGVSRAQIMTAARRW